MYVDLAHKIMNILHDFYKEQRSNVKLFFRGEEAMLIYLSKKQLNNDLITPSIISDNLNISTARVATSLNGLQKKGYITREIDKDDRRKIIIKLTNIGNKKANELKQNNLSKTVEILSKLGQEDTEEFIRITKKIKEILKEDQELCLS